MSNQNCSEQRQGSEQELRSLLSDSRQSCALLSTNRRGERGTIFPHIPPDSVASHVFSPWGSVISLSFSSSGRNASSAWI